MSTTTIVTVERLDALRAIFKGRASRARAAARQLGKDDPAAAALRGKAKGYDEASDALVALIAGNPLPLVNPQIVGDRGARLRARKRAEVTS